jgi:hypothetical protein
LALEFPELKLVVDRKVTAAKMKLVMEELRDKVADTGSVEYYKMFRLAEVASQDLPSACIHEDNFQVGNPISVGWISYPAWAAFVESLVVVSTHSPFLSRGLGSADIAIDRANHFRKREIFVYPSGNMARWVQEIGIYETWNLETVCYPLKAVNGFFGRSGRMFTKPAGDPGGTVLLTGLYDRRCAGRSYENVKKAEFMENTILNYPEELTFVKKK